MQSKYNEKENSLQGLFRLEMSKNNVVDDTVITALIKKEAEIMEKMENFIDLIESVEDDNIIYNYTNLINRLHAMVVKVVCKRIKFAHYSKGETKNE